MDPTLDNPDSLVVVDPNGRRVRVPLHPFPFRIGRAQNNHLILRDSRISRNHAQIAHRNGACVVEDLESRHGVWINGQRIEKSQVLRGAERIEFGVPDGYQLHFTATQQEVDKLMVRPASGETGRAGAANLEKLRAVLEVARSLQSSFSTDDVLNTVVDATISVTGSERGFLLLFDENHELQVRSARASGGSDLPPDELRVPRRVIQQALESRRDLFTMSFDPVAALSGGSPGNTIADLELRSVACVPLVRINLSGGNRTQTLGGPKSNAGVLYMDSRVSTVDLAGGNRELLQTLAIEASTVLENARLLEEERQRQHIEEELCVARRIQQSLLPVKLPDVGWFRVAGSSEASHEVGGDYFDVVAAGPDAWSIVVADVAGKGVSSALLASFLQGAFLGAAAGTSITDVLSRINLFLSERAEHGKYATVFYGMLHGSGRMDYANAGHCAPLLVRSDGTIESLGSTSMPVGLMPDAAFPVEQCLLKPGDRLVLYTDGVTEAADLEGVFFGRHRLREAVAESFTLNCAGMHKAIQQTVRGFTKGVEQGDDITIVVVEFRAPV